MSALRDLTGCVFGRLTITGRSNARGERPMWSALCKCGGVTTVQAGNLRSGASTSCGCLQREAASQLAKDRATHGQTDTPTYRSWSSMKTRCGDESNPDYGGRGITMCARWAVFENFLADMGQRPDGLTLERVDVNGNYEKNNCRWATTAEQNRNRRDNVIVTINGETMCFAQWCERLGVSKSAAYARLRRKWSPTAALFGKETACTAAL